MDRKKLVLLLVALIIAVGTAMVARSMFAGASAPQAQAAPVVPTGPKVLVAQRALPAGTIITAESIGFQSWPAEMVADAYFLEGESDLAKLLGTVVRHPITAGEPVTQGSLVSPGDRGFLAAALSPGMRAITVPVSAQTGVAGFVFPGDRVDIMLTQEVAGVEGAALKASETIMRNLRVLATDQSTSQETENGKTVVRESRTVTLEVTPKMAEKIAVAETIGQLSLSLRSLSDNQSDLESALASGDISIPDNATPEQEERLLRRAMARPDDKIGSFSTGGDVSRFQRSTIPPQVARNQGPQQMGGTGPVQNVVGAEPARPTGPQVRIMRGTQTDAVGIDKNGQAVPAGAGTR